MVEDITQQTIYQRTFSSWSRNIILLSLEEIRFFGIC